MSRPAKTKDAVRAKTGSICLAAAALVSLSFSPSPLLAGWIRFCPNEPPTSPDISVEYSGPDASVLNVSVTGMNADDVETEIGTFAKISMPTSGIGANAGAPMLPVLRRHVEIPQGAAPTLEILSVEYVEARLSDLGIDNPIYPVQPPIPKIPGGRESAGFAFDENAYSSGEFEPDTAARLGEIGELRGRRFVELEIYPIRYAPAAGKLLYMTNAKLRVSYTGADWTATQRNLKRYASPDFDAFAGANLLNAQKFSQKAPFSLPIGYLIIVYDQFAEEIEPLASLRHKLGYKTTVTKLSQIPGTGTNQDIKSYIQDAYDNWETPPTFVLLVGDTYQIPGFMGPNALSVTDLYYATMGGPDDWIPDIFVGRFSCDSENEVSALATKSSEYVKLSVSSGTDWIKKASFMSSTDQWQITEGSHEYVIGTWLDSDGYSSSKRYTYTYAATSEQVKSDINAGISQLVYSGHGLVGSWEDGPILNSSDIFGLTNDEKWPVVLSYCCLAGKYDESCLGETWTNVVNGAVIFWGSSTYSTWVEDDMLERAVYDAWFGESYTWIKGALNQGLWAIYEYYAAGGLSHAYYEQYNLLGDPALDPWTEPPQALAASFDEIVPIGGSSFEVEVRDESDAIVEGAMVCISKGEVLHKVAYTGADGRAAFAIDASATEDPGAIDVAASKHNFIPFIGSADIEAEPADTEDTDTGQDTDKGDDDTGQETDTGGADTDSGSSAVDAGVDTGSTYDAGVKSITVQPFGMNDDNPVDCGCKAAGARIDRSIIHVLLDAI